MKSKSVAEQFALTHKYDIVNHYSIWNGSDIYIAERNSDKDLFIGYPTFIIVKDDKARFATPTETLNIMDIHPVDANDNEGEFIV